MEHEDDFLGLLEELQVGMSGPVRASVKSQGATQLTGKTKRRDRSDRATIETVLDPRTCKALVKLKNGGAFTALHGCIATGKEANVYQADGENGQELAIKIYKTSILVFKDRRKYVAGDFRFQRGYTSSNPRKMVQVWAEKEMRNLARIHAASIPCPKPHALRMHVLIMDFLGSAGTPAPRLHDAKLNPQQLKDHYTELVLLIRRLYQDCRLVHADLSEFNLLVHEGQLFLLDVSQSVDLDHPLALEFLRADAQHVNAFFRRKGIPTLTTRELFEFTVDPSIAPGNMHNAIAALLAATQLRGADVDDDIDDAVFAQAYIPRKLEEVEDHERDYARLAAAQGAACDGIYYQVITGMKADMSGARTGPSICEVDLPAGREGHSGSEQSPSSLRSEASSSDSDSEAGTAAAAVHPATSAQRHEAQNPAQRDAGPMEREGNGDPRDGAANGSGKGSDDTSSEASEAGEHESDDLQAGKAVTKEQRKAHKKAVKEANRERRSKKIPKHVKKKLVNKHKRK